MKLTAQQVLYGYTVGIFPMAVPDQGYRIEWYEPELRGIIPLDGLKVSHSMKQVLRQQKFHVTMNRSFEEVIRKCAARFNVWISEEIIDVFCELHHMGFAHSFETRNEHEELVGGLYGVALGKAFFGESMFHRETDASKVALVYLVEWMKANDFTLLDTQYTTDHLRSLGAIDIPQDEYLERLKEALK